MPISDTEKVDFLFKKVGYELAKTAGSTLKTPDNESRSSPIVVNSKNIWLDSIPDTKNNAIAQGIAEDFFVELTADATVAARKTWLAPSNKNNWISKSYGNTYILSVLVADSGANNEVSLANKTQIQPAGTGSDGFLIDYISGVIHFADSNIPASLTTARSVYVIGTRYIGALGSDAAKKSLDLTQFSTTQTPASGLRSIINGISGSGSLVFQSGASLINPSLSGSSLTINGSGFVNAVNSLIDGAVSTSIVAGSGISTIYDAIANTLTISSPLTAGSGISVETDPTVSGAYKISAISVPVENISNFDERVDDRVANLLTQGSGIGLTYIDGANTLQVAVTGIPSSLVTNFNSSVSGLLPTIANSGDNRLLTSTGSTVGINAESNLTFDGTTFVCSGNARIGTAHYLESLNGTISIKDRNNNNFILFNSQEGKLAYAGSDSFNWANRQLIGPDNSVVLGWSSGIVVNQGKSTNLQNVLVIDNSNFLYLYGTNGGLISSEDSSIDKFSLTNGLIENSPIGIIQPSSGNFTSLKVNNIPVSVSGHTHLSSDITNFNSSVSGLVSGLYVPVSRTITPGSGLVGSSSLDLSANRTLDVGEGDGISVSANAVAVDSTVVRTSNNQNISGVKVFQYGIFNANLDNSNRAITITSGNANFDSSNNSGYGLSFSNNYDKGGNVSDLIIGYNPEKAGSEDHTRFFAGTDTVGVLSTVDTGYATSTSKLIFAINPTTTQYGFSETTLKTTLNSGNITIDLPNIGGTVALLSDINSSRFIGTLPISKGGTGRNSISNGQLLIGSGNNFAANTLTAGTGISITSGSGTISINVDNTVIRTIGNQTIDGQLIITSGLNLSNSKITNLATPTADTDAATKAYVDAARAGLDVKQSVRVATTIALNTAISVTYGSNTISGNTNAGVLPNIDGISLNVGDRILVKDETSANIPFNGIYTVSSLGNPIGSSWTLTRATDADSSAEVTAGMFTFVTEGTANADSGWVLTTNDTITLNTTNLTFAQFSGAGQITAGSGLTKSGNILDVGTASSSRIVVNADNIDLALVNPSSTAGSDGINFVQSTTVDNYGRVTGVINANIRNATTSDKGIASFDTNSFSVTTGAVSIKSSGVSNSQLANSSVTIGSTNIGLGSTATTLTGLSSITSTTFIGNLSGTVTSGVITSRNINTASGITGGGDLSTDRTLQLATAYGDTVNPYSSKNANTVLAAPTGSSGAPSFRNLVPTDIPGTINSLVVNNAGAGTASPFTFNGNTAQTLSYNSIGAPSISGVNAVGTWNISVTGNAGSASLINTATTSSNINNLVVVNGTTGNLSSLVNNNLRFDASNNILIGASGTSSDRSPITKLEYFIIDGGTP